MGAADGLVPRPAHLPPFHDMRSQLKRNYTWAASADIPQTWPESAHFGSISAEFQPSSANVGQDWPGTDQFGQVMGRRCRPICDLNLPLAVKSGPASVGFGPMLVECGPTSTNSLAGSLEIGHISSMWISTKIGPNTI